MKGVYRFCDDYFYCSYRLLVNKRRGRTYLNIICLNCQVSIFVADFNALGYKETFY